MKIHTFYPNIFFCSKDDPNLMDPEHAFGAMNFLGSAGMIIWSAAYKEGQNDARIGLGEEAASMVYTFMSETNKGPTAAFEFVSSLMATITTGVAIHVSVETAKHLAQLTTHLNPGGGYVLPNLAHCKTADMVFINIEAFVEEFRDKLEGLPSIPEEAIEGLKEAAERHRESRNEGLH